MAKTKRFMDGGFVPPNTYPFANQNTPSSDTSVKVGAQQEPLGQDMGAEQQFSLFKRGGKVKAYAKGGSVRGGGCEVKGKTKGRMV